MGLINLAKDVLSGGMNAVTGSLQSAAWKEYFESGEMSGGILMKRGEKIVVSGGKNTKSDDNFISSGSGIDVQEGQCMILVENGRIVEFCAEPGRYTYDSSTAPSVFSGENKGLKALGKEILSQWSAGGQRFSTQRVYFINLGEIISAPIKWGCGDIAFHHTTQMLNGAPPIELDITLKGNGQVTIKINDPVKFYTMIGAQVAGTDSASVIRVTDEGIMSNLKSGIVDKVAEAISALGAEQPTAYTAIRSKSSEITRYMNEFLSNEWAGERGFEICSFTVNGSFTPTEEDKDAIQEMQKTFTMGANMNAANYDIQKTMARGVEAAGQNGGTNGLFGVGMGMNMIGGAGLGNMTAQPMQATPQQPASVAPNVKADTWTCGCGQENTGKFCVNCGNSKPVADEWVCSCGARNTGKFCPECGAAKPVVKKYKCDKCGWVPEDETKPPKFCPECGDPFNEQDA